MLAAWRFTIAAATVLKLVKQYVSHFLSALHVVTSDEQLGASSPDTYRVRKMVYMLVKRLAALHVVFTCLKHTHTFIERVGALRYV